ncbi:MAG: hypothetical protein COW32_01500 [Candidatus Aquicultor secundus]|nr:MAG: hypothetical protein COW32_01500 [Candidatus Aquicultor secundus]
MYSIFDLIGAVFQLIFWVIIIGGIIIVVRYFMNLSKVPEEEIIQRWSQLLPNQAELQKEWLSRVESELDKKKFPYSTYNETISEGFTSSDEQRFLVCQLDGDYMCYIGCIPIGTDLHVNWALREKRAAGCFNFPIIGPFLFKLLKGAPFTRINKVNAFASVVLDATVNAAGKIFDEKMLDKSYLNRKSSGKLGPL